MQDKKQESNNINNNISDELLFMLSSTDVNCQIQAVNELAKIAGIESYEILKKLLKKKNPVLKTYIKQALAQLENVFKSTDEKLYNQLMEQKEAEAALKKSKKSGGPAAASQNQGQQSGAGEDTSGGKEGPDAKFELTDERLVILKSSIADEDLKKRILAAKVCPKFGRNAEIEKLLIERLEIEQNNFVIATLLIALGKCSVNSTKNIIADFLTNADERVRANAVEGLEFLEDSGVISLLMPFANDSSVRVRTNIARFLCKYDQAAVRNILVDMINSNDEEQVDAAKYVIAAAKFDLESPAASEKSAEQKEKAKKSAVLNEKKAQAPKSSPVSIILALILFFSTIIFAYYYFKDVNTGSDSLKIGSEDGVMNKNSSKEVELRLAGELAGEIEAKIAERKFFEARYALNKLNKKKRDDMNYIFEAEIKIGEGDFHEAFKSLKNINKLKLADKLRARFYFNLGICYHNFKNYEQAAEFYKIAKNSSGSENPYKSKAESLEVEVIKQIAAVKECAQKLASDFFKTCEIALNNEGPKALKIFLTGQNVYDDFEKKWRANCSDIKNWYIKFNSLTNEISLRPGGKVEIISKVLQEWHLLSFGGYSCIYYYYTDFEFSEAADIMSGKNQYLTLKNIKKIKFDHGQPADYEKNAVAFLSMAQAADSGKTDEIKLARSAFDQNSGNVIAAMELISNSEGQTTAEIETLCDAAKKIKPENYVNYFKFGPNCLRASLLDLIANFYLNAGKSEKFLETINLLISEKSDYAQAYLELAIYYSKLGDLKKANEFYGKAFKNEPDFPALEIYYHNDAFTENFSLMKKIDEVPDLNPNDLLDEFDILIRTYPSYWRTYYNAGRFLMLKEDYESASLFFNKALEITPDNFTAVSRLAFCYYRMNKPDLARKAIDKAEKLLPDNFYIKKIKKGLTN